MQFDPSLLEHVGDLDGAQLTVPALSMVIAYSQAISLKRIADMLDANAGRTVAVATEGEAPEVFTFGAAIDAEKPQTRAKVLRKTPPIELPEGFTQWDNDSGDSPVDRNLELSVAHANGKTRKLFAGSVAWMTKPADPWRVIGYKVLGDGSNKSGE